MANTSFNVGLNTTTINYFQKKIHRRLRKQSLAEQLSSEGADSCIEKVTELKNTDWGYHAYLTLVPDDTSGGVVGDNRLQDREQSITSYDQAITYDLHRKGFMNEGSQADRSTWLKFAQLASDQLTYWAADMRDKLMMNTLSGVGYEYELDGSVRDASKNEWAINRYAGDVTPPSARRHFQIADINGTISRLNDTVNHNTLLSAHVPKWGSFIDMKSALPMMRIKPIRGKWGHGSDLYVCIVHPYVMGALKKDEDFQRNWREALGRGEKNPLFYGAESYLVDGILIISHRYAYTTIGAASKWGANKTVDGARTLFLGAQAMGMVEIGGPFWRQREDDYANRMGIMMGLRLGMKKLVWPDQYAGNAQEDFGVVALDHGVTPVGGLTYTV
jgi:N4-gp56 family major capsid protein